jgi:hypothetical protein
MCRSSTKTWPRRAATIPGAGAVRGNRSQLAARFNPGTIRPNTRIDAPQPQKERGQPAGRPPTTWPRPPFISAIASRCEVAGCSCRWCSLRYDANLSRRYCGPEKSQGMVALHSEAVTEGREGRASEALDESTIKKDAIRTRVLRMQDSICEACPDAEANNCWAKMRLSALVAMRKKHKRGTFLAGLT